MTTVFERCSFHGYTDYITTSRTGELVAARFWAAGQGERIRVESVEPHGTFYVWAYPDDFTDEIDRAIKEVNAAIAKDTLNRQPLKEDRPKRKRIGR